MLEDPSHPLAFSSLKNGSPSVDILTSDNLFAVFEENPVCLLNAMEDMQGRTRTKIPFEHPYSLCVFYRKSLNPHGPSTRPIFIATFEFSEMTCRSTGGGFFDSLMGEKRRPVEAYMIGNSPTARTNHGLHQMNFSKDEARARLVDLAEKHLKLYLPLVFLKTTNTHWEASYSG
jgi:hypothetical protein